MARNCISVLNGDFDPVTLDQSLDRVFELVDGPERGWVCTVNVAILMMMRSDPRLQRFVDQAACTVADGQPIVGLSRVFGAPLPERVAGIDLIGRICARAADAGVGVYLLGSSRPVVDKVVSRMRSDHPGLEVSFADGYFDAAQAHERAAAVAASGAQILLVGMGVPRQEVFIEEQWETMGVDVAIGVGGSFEVLAGIRTRAPHWMQRSGLEWLHRLLAEPKRLFPRYFLTGLRFLVLGIRSIVLPRFRRV